MRIHRLIKLNFFLYYQLINVRAMTQVKCLTMSLGMWKMRSSRMRIRALTKDPSVISQKLLLKLQQKNAHQQDFDNGIIS